MRRCDHIMDNAREGRYLRLLKTPAVSLMTEPSRADIYGSRARIGYTSPPLTTEVFPYEFYRIVPAGVTLVVTSLAIVVRSKDEVDQSYDISMRAAREMAAAGCDIVVLGGRADQSVARRRECASRSSATSKAELNVKVSTSASAQAAAAKALGCRKVVVAQPYEKTEPTGSPATPGISAARSWARPAGARAFNQIGRIPRRAAIEMGRALMRRASRRRLDPVPVAALADGRRARCRWSASSASTA